MNNKVKMKRHESFSIREGWLAKGIRTIKEDSKVFSSADTVILPTIDLFIIFKLFSSLPSIYK